MLMFYSKNIQLLVQGRTDPCREYSCHFIHYLRHSLLSSVMSMEYYIECFAEWLHYFFLNSITLQNKWKMLSERTWKEKKYSSKRIFLQNIVVKTILGCLYIFEKNFIRSPLISHSFQHFMFFILMINVFAYLLSVTICIIFLVSIFTFLIWCSTISNLE